MREWNRVLLGVVIGSASGLAVMAALTVVGAAWLLSDQPLDEEHARLIEQLRRGSFANLDDVSPAPDGVIHRGEYADPPPGFKYCLVYGLQSSRPLRPSRRALVILMDKDLRLIEYRVEQD